MVKMTKKTFCFLESLVMAAVFIVMMSGCPNGSVSDGGAETVILTGALKGLKLDEKLEGYDLKIAALDGDGNLLGEAKLEKIQGGNLSIGKGAGSIPVSRNIEYGASADYSYVLEDLPSSTRIDFVLRAREETLESDRRVNFDLADFDSAFSDFSTGLDANQSAPDSTGLELPAMGLSLQKVAISHASWNGKTPDQVEGMPLTVQLLIRDSNGFELGNASGGSVFRFSDGTKESDYELAPFWGYIPGKAANNLTILVEIPTWDEDGHPGVFVMVPQSITIEGAPGSLTITDAEAKAGEKTVTDKILITLVAP
jgi:hypothetical protein